MKKTFLFIILIFAVSGALAQPGPPPPDPGEPLPIGGIEVLLVGGAALGIRKLITRKKARNSDQDVD